MFYWKMRFPGGRSKALTLSYDDGVCTDRRLIEIMNRHGLKGTFNINSGKFLPEGTASTPTRRMSEGEARECYLGSGQEVAIHGLYHGWFHRMPSATASYELCEDRRRLELLTGKVVRGMAYPFGNYTAETLQLLRANGIAYARTTKAHKSFVLPDEFLAWHPTCHHKDPALWELTERFLEAPSSGHYEDSSLFYLWGHSYEFERDGNWELIERFAETVGGREEIWYATNGELYRYLTAYRRLEWGVEQKTVYNPNGADVWIAGCNWGKVGDTVQVPAGEEVRLVEA